MKDVNEVYRETCVVPYVVRFLAFADRFEPTKAKIRLFCLTEDRLRKTEEKQHNFVEIARSSDLEVHNNNYCLG